MFLSRVHSLQLGLASKETTRQKYRGIAPMALKENPSLERGCEIGDQRCLAGCSTRLGRIGGEEEGGAGEGQSYEEAYEFVGVVGAGDYAWSVKSYDPEKEH